MKNKIDCTRYSNLGFLQLIKGNPKYQQAIASKKQWLDVVKVIDNLNVIYSDEQIEYVKKKQWN